MEELNFSHLFQSFSFSAAQKFVLKLSATKNLMLCLWLYHPIFGQKLSQFTISI